MSDHGRSAVGEHSVSHSPDQEEVAFVSMLCFGFKTLFSAPPLKVYNLSSISRSAHILEFEWCESLYFTITQH